MKKFSVLIMLISLFFIGCGSTEKQMKARVKQIIYDNIAQTNSIFAEKLTDKYDTVFKLKVIPPIKAHVDRKNKIVVTIVDIKVDPQDGAAPEIISTEMVWKLYDDHYWRTESISSRVIVNLFSIANTLKEPK